MLVDAVTCALECGLSLSLEAQQTVDGEHCYHHCCAFCRHPFLSLVQLMELSHVVICTGADSED